MHAIHGGGASSTPAPALSSGWHVTHADNDFPPEGMLTRAQFLRMVQREKRRTDRSNSALSIAVLQFTTEQPRARDAACAEVRSIVRETDYTAAIDDDGIAVLLTDTGEAGLQGFVDKATLSSRSARLRLVAGATYPDSAFDRLVAERLSTPRSRHSVDEDFTPSGATSGVYASKRVLDVCCAAVALALLSPLMLVIALIIKLTSPGPVIYRQQRIGQGGQPFTFYKFRSMRTDNSDQVHRDFVASLIDGKPKERTDAPAGAAQFKMKADPRVTAIGRFIRKTSIDEIPQFYNVLKGDMSLVGPRPPVEYEAERYKTWHRRRVLELKPGLTGIWQVEGRSRVSFDDMVRMDLRYLRECSLRTDLSILLRTVRVVLTGEGAR